MRHYRNPLLVFILLVLPFLSKAQSSAYSVNGSVADTLNNVQLQYASITLLRAEDSVLAAFTRTNAQGQFDLHPSKNGKFILMISFPGFADYIDIVKLNDKSTVSLGVIPMVSKTHLLQEIVVKQQIAAIKVKGDTTEYMADSFKVKDNATVEDLLKKLPGIQVDKNGQVTAQGEQVAKILVDGEEFFSDDPAIVTKGLQANAVERVQVFDKKSDQAEFTGIDDGQKTKTINLQLKEDKKKGYFGKLNVGGGTNQYYENQGMINAFKGKRQVSAFGIVSNTDKVGLGWQDREKYGNDGSTTTGVSEDGGIYTMYNSDDEFSSWDGSYNGQGLPKVWTGGVHFADKWGKDDAYHTTGNYRYAKQNLETEGYTTTEYTIPESRYFTNEHSNKFSTGQRHGADGMFEWKIDTTSSLKVTVNAGYRETQTSTSYQTQAVSNDQDTSYNSHRTLTSDANSKNFDASMLYRKKFAKKGRTLSISFNENYRENASDGFLNSFTHYYTTSRDSIIDQHKINNSANLIFKGKATYTEPLSKITFLEVNYALAVNNSNSEKNSYDKQPTGEYTDSLNQMYSSNYMYNILQNSGGASFRVNYKKINFAFGGDMSNTAYKQKNLSSDTLYHRSYEYSYNNFFPRVNFSYKPNKQSSINLNYYGSSRQPTIDQIQPLRDNTDPLNVPIGNPGLTQQFNHTVSARYNFYKVLNGEYLWSNASYTFINNAISRADNVNPDGTRSYQYLNVQGNYNAYLYLGYNFKVKNVRLGARINTNISRNKTFVNGVENISNNNGYGIDFDFNYEIENKFSIYFTPGVGYSDNKSSISTYTTSYWYTGNDLTVTCQLPKKIELGTFVTWYMRQRTPGFEENTSVVRWNAYVSKKMLKKDQLELRVSAFDLLNQNKGINRYAQNNYVTQTNYNTIRRYGLISVIWNFSHTPMSAPQNSDSNK